MEQPTFTVSELNAAIAGALGRAFPDEIWIRGEIRDLVRARSGHVYFTLTEPTGEPGAPADVVPVTLFAADRRAVNRVLSRSRALRMTDGVEVRIRGKLGHYPARGTVQLRMTWIDADYTVGRLAADRELLLRRLGAAGLFEANASRPVPAVPLRVGLVTSAGSAAHADFLDELRASGYAWRVTEADVRVQGPESAPSIVAALTALGTTVDVIALVRGGGAATDLASFDDERVARAIAAAPVVVFTGIGHEVDATVADAVAARSYKTPTACAAGIVALVRAFLGDLGELGRRVGRAGHGGAARSEAALRGLALQLGAVAGGGIRAGRSAVDRSADLVAGTARRAVSTGRHDVASAGQGVAAAAAPRLGVAAADVARSLRTLRARAPVTLQRALARLGATEHRVVDNDPGRLLARGWSITRDDTGRALTSVRDVAVGSALSTRLADGELGSVVERAVPHDAEARRR